MRNTYVSKGATGGGVSDHGALSGLTDDDHPQYAREAVANTWTAAQAVASVTLTDGANIATNAALGNVFTVTLGGDRTLDNPTNMVSGGTYVWIATQDGTGGRSLAFGAAFKWDSGGAPTTSMDALTANDKTVITAVYDGTHLLASFTNSTI
jgi:hypothetical protein